MTVTVLVVDDSATERSVARLILETGGFAVREAPDGPTALEVLRSGERCDLVLLNRMMPGWDGLETLARIRRRR